MAIRGVFWRSSEKDLIKLSTIISRCFARNILGNKLYIWNPARKWKLYLYCTCRIFSYKAFSRYVGKVFVFVYILGNLPATAGLFSYKTPVPAE